MLAYAALCDSVGAAVEPHIAPCLTVFFERLSDKVRDAASW
jgi:hypothetical protein